MEKSSNKTGESRPRRRTKKTTVWLLERLRDEVKSWPAKARRAIGFQLSKVELGGEPDDFKPMQIIGSGVNEIRISELGDQYRLIYIAKFPEAIYVLHVITKKTTQQTAFNDIQKAKTRYKLLLEWRKEQKL